MWVVGGFSKNVKPHKLHGRRIADKGGNKEMASWSKALLSFRLEPHPSVPSSSTPRLSFCSNSFSSSPSFIRYSLFFAFKTSAVIKLNNSSAYPLITSRKPTPFSPSFSSTKFVCKAAEYKFPDPIPEFADAVSSLFLLLHIYGSVILVCIVLMENSPLGFSSLFGFRKRISLESICSINCPRRISSETLLKKS